MVTESHGHPHQILYAQQRAVYILVKQQTTMLRWLHYF
jgi:hypothetical protein